MKIYIAIIEDRHTDIMAYPFTEKAAAIKWAQMTGKEYAHDPDEDYSEETEEVIRDRISMYGDGVTGLVFRVSYSCEEDQICVWESELDGELKKVGRNN